MPTVGEKKNSGTPEDSLAMDGRARWRRREEVKRGEG
jgi:hypothetical protein